jgi:hypothetical protein
MFCGIAVQMYYADDNKHKRPHIHVRHLVVSSEAIM